MSLYSTVVFGSLISTLQYFNSSFNSNYCTFQFNTTVVRQYLLYYTDSRTKVTTVTVW